MKNIFTYHADPLNQNVYLFYENGQLTGYAFDRTEACKFCLYTIIHGRLCPRKHPIKGQLIKKNISETYKGWLAKNHKLLKLY